jgi:hypothetical protein
LITLRRGPGDFLGRSPALPTDRPTITELDRAAWLEHAARIIDLADAVDPAVVDGPARAHEARVTAAWYRAVVADDDSDVDVDGR